MAVRVGEMSMYKKILITTDGSAVSRHTACAGVEFARQMGAEVLALYVAPSYQFPVYGDMVLASYPSQEEYCAHMRRAGDEHLGSVIQACSEAGLHSAGLTTFSDSPALDIVAVAEQQRCDLIFMGSHGRSGWGQLLLGSVTNKVLSHTSRPVLVHRLVKQPSA